MGHSADRPETRLATRLGFFCAGFAMACWAPLVPFAKSNVGVGDGELGLLLLCLGIGSVVAMPLTGYLSARIGSKPMILGGGLGLVLCLPLLALIGHPLALGGMLALFGASLGTLDVAINIHAVEVEKDSGQPLMSGFHGLFSVGGFAGAGGMTLLLSSGLGPVASALAGSALTLAALVLAWPRLLRRPLGEPARFVAPHGIVLLLAGLAAVTFLVEGAMLDWSALLIVGKGQMEVAQGGIGYMLFSIAMTIGRLTGDRIVARLGNFRVLVLGGFLAVCGFAVLLLSRDAVVSMTGFILIGLGSSNIVPVLFSAAGRQTVMPASLAIAAVTTTGYAGVLAGPAAVGFMAQAFDLQSAFWMLAGLMCLIPLCARQVSRS
jgi:predicted MFS family arabinose efflux permease